ncbi:bifunctional riboflavin kinase/FAD synthetase [Leucobacter viscericola]|uniref:Riboflavin biosynthesis protein n=1 Tax=Leucobacter viscericola TaxID=2714935 RepID=A0A6G7XHH7_9MICO|nr:bifunctional riboflavin kinase/FAD synthetase [Leucobacter viscericola]QIK64015.1 bifunctional riboflavin kinase/FAD synthetase [Leucobacter viscericola]
MRVFESLAAIPEADFAAGSAVAIGKFDGVHLGHQAILARLIEAARGDNSHSVVFTFANNPLSYLRPEVCPLPLMSREQRIEALSDAGVENCVMVEFDEAFSQIPAEEFVEKILVGQLRARHIIMGSDFRFGHGGVGDAHLLRSLSTRLGFTVEVVAAVVDPQAGCVSSTRVREAILAGDAEAASSMIGRPVTVRGEVVHGDARGRDLGFPTANLGGRIEGLVPSDGVYAGFVRIDGAQLPAAISVGNNPTFTPDGQSRVEAFILDFDEDIYGSSIEVLFTHRIRSMERFDSLESLIEQMDADVVLTRRLTGADRAE